MPYHPDRIDGAAEWTKLSPEFQAMIGAAADPGGGSATAIARAFEAAADLCSDRLLEAVTENVPAIDPKRPPLPASLGDVCRTCGCSHEDPCEDGCGWLEPDLCTGCGDRQDPPAPLRLA
jgi:hypothetical protein